MSTDGPTNTIVAASAAVEKPIDTERDEPQLPSTTATNSRKQDHNGKQEASEPDMEMKTAVSDTATPTSLMNRPPKMRLKLSMRKLPMLANRKQSALLPRPGHGNNSDEDDDEDDGEVKATIADSDDGGEDHAVAAVLGDDEPLPQTTADQHQHAAAGFTTTSSAKPPKRRSVGNPPRQIRLPPIASPGLYMAPPSVIPKDRIAKNGLIAPADVFDHHMELAGYTKENRTRRPHRGSSVTRTIGDMFDSNVALSIRFPTLIPPVSELNEQEEQTDEMDIDGESKSNDLRQRLIDSLNRKLDRQEPPMTESVGSRKRHKSLRMSDMLPVTLTIPLPDDFVQNQVKYVEDVNAREHSIIQYQDAVFMAQSSRTDDGSDDNNGSVLADINLPKVPAIPDPPAPPKLNQLSGPLAELYREHGDGHLCMPRGKEEYVAHLDPTCFHITEGRYFGLASNFIADPNFVGPNAPGVAGMNASGGSGLATSSSGGGISGAMALTLSTTYNGTTAGSAAAFRGGAATTSTFPFQNHNGSKVSPTSATDSITAASATVSVSDSPCVNPLPVEEPKDIGPRPTATFSDLKKIFDDNGPLLQSMREYIVKAAVHASRSGHHGVSWLGPDGETYPDISRAFACYAGIKPCQRCKSNKQGAYHCRLRRKHTGVDHDGGNSSAVLSPLLLAPMESLLPDK